MNTKTSSRWLGLGLSLLSVLIWGISPIALSIALQVIDVYTVSWFSLLTSFGILAIYLALRQQLPQIKNLRLIPLKLLIIAIVFWMLNYVLFIEGLKRTSSSNAEVLIQLGPVFLGLGAIAFFKEKYTLFQWVGLGILTTGYTFFFKEQLRVLITASSQYLVGSSLIVLAAAAWAIYALTQKQLLQRLSSNHIMLIIYGACSLILIPFAQPQQILTLIEKESLTSLHFWMLILYALITLTSYCTFAAAMQHWEASRVSGVLAVTPIVTLITVDIVAFFMPKIMPPEQITTLGMIGAIFVVIGSIAIALGQKKSPQTLS